MKKNRPLKSIRKSLPPKRKKPEKSHLKIALTGAVLTGVALLIANIFYSSPKPSFSGERAFRYLKMQCDFGPRAPGSEGHQKCGDFLVEELKKYADSVWEQAFDYTDREDTSRVYRGRNIIASFNLKPPNNYRVLLCAHWDTRPYADKDADPANRRLPVPGANDGASGVAALLEMARILKQHPLDFGVDIILFDLEDLGAYNASLYPDSLNQFCIGSEHFAGSQPEYRPRYGILLDMVGDKSLIIKKEGYSVANAGSVVNKVWAAARKTGASAFVEEEGELLQDDHVPFLKRGIPVIDLIDFDYPYWHTIQDTPDKCSAESLQQVGDVLVEVLYGGE